MILQGPQYDPYKAQAAIKSIHQNLISQGLEENQDLNEENPNASSRKNKIIFNYKKHNFFVQMKKMKIVKKIVEIFKDHSSKRKPEKLTKFHYQLLDDFTMNPFMQVEKNKSNLSSNNTYLKLKKMFKGIPLITPNSKFKLLWNTLIMIIIFFNLFFISIQLAFSYNLINSEFYYINITLFIIDIFLNFNSSYYENGVIVNKNKKIIKNYLNKDFIYDLIGLFGLIFSFPELLPFNWFSILFLVHLRTVYNNYNNLEEIIYWGDSFDLIMVIFKIICFAHIFACIWHAAAFYPTKTSQNWLKVHFLEESVWQTKYLYSIYWALQTMVTVGYGDFQPQNEIEVGVCILTYLFGTIVYGYSLNCIGSLLTKIEDREKELKEDMRIIVNYMQENNINFKLRDRVKKYLQFMWKLQYKNIHKEQMILEKLPKIMKEEILLESIGRKFINFPVLFKNFSQEFLNKLVLIAKPVRYFPEEIIYRKGELENTCLYLILNGEVELNNGKDRKLFLKRKNKTLCEYEFFSENPRNETAKSKTFTTLLKIDKSDFLLIIKEFPTDYEIFCQIRDNHTFYSQINDLHTTCFSCNSSTHIFYKCPILSYTPNRFLYLAKLNYSKFQTRDNFIRRGMSFQRHTLKQLGKIRSEAYKARFDKSIMSAFSNGTMDSKIMKSQIIGEDSEIKYFRSFSAPVSPVSKQTNSTSLKLKYNFKSLENVITTNFIDFCAKNFNERKKKIKTILLNKKDLNTQIEILKVSNEKINKEPSFEKIKKIKNVTSNDSLPRSIKFVSIPTKPNLKKSDSKNDKSDIMSDNEDFLVEKIQNGIDFKKHKTKNVYDSISDIDENELKSIINDPIGKLMFLGDFDAIKEYKKYFKHNNISNVLDKFKNKRKSRADILKPRKGVLFPKQ